MKKKYTFQRTNQTAVEVVTPYGDGEGADKDGLFDDCYLCQKLKRDLQLGIAEQVDGDREDPWVVYERKDQPAD